MTVQEKSTVVEDRDFVYGDKPAAACGCAAASAGAAPKKEEKVGCGCKKCQDEAKVDKKAEKPSTGDSSESDDE